MRLPRQIDLAVILIPVIFVFFYSPSKADFYHRCRRTTPLSQGVKDNDKIVKVDRNNNQYEHSHPASSSQHGSGTTGFSTLLDDIQNTKCSSCYLNDAVATFKLLVDSPKQQPVNSQQLPPFHVIILLTTQKSFERCMITTAGLLTQGAHVTILAAPDMPTEEMIRPALSQHIPCDQQGSAHTLLEFRTFDILSEMLTCHSKHSSKEAISPLSSSSPVDVMWCSILNAKSLFRSMVEPLRETLANIAIARHSATENDDDSLYVPDISISQFTHQTQQYSEQPQRPTTTQQLSLTSPPLTQAIILTDATCVAGFLLAELFMVPSILLVESTDLLRQVLGTQPLPFGSSPTKHLSHHEMSPSSITHHFQRLKSAAHDRLYSLDLTSAFVTLNRVRRALGLPRIRTLRQIWQPHTTSSSFFVKRSNFINPHQHWLWVNSNDADGWKQVLPNLLTFSGPFLPPCLPCDQEAAETNDKIVLKTDDVDFDDTDDDVKRDFYRYHGPPELHRSIDLLASTLTRLLSTSSRQKKPLAPVLMSVLSNETSLMSSVNVEQGMDSNNTTNANSTDANDNQDAKPTIVVATTLPKDAMGRGLLRRLVQGMAMARRSMQQFVLCRATSTSNSCWKNVQDFQVVLLGFAHDLVLPSFIRYKEQSTLIELLATSRPTLGIVSHCDSSSEWMHHLGPPVLCLDVKWSANEFAYNLLKMLRVYRFENQQRNENQNMEVDVLSKVVAAIQNITLGRPVETHTMSNSAWRTHCEDERDAHKHCSDKSGEETIKSVAPFIKFFVYPAWLIVGAVLVYLLSKNSFQLLFGQQCRIKPNTTLCHHSSSSNTTNNGFRMRQRSQHQYNHQQLIHSSCQDNHLQEHPELYYKSAELSTPTYWGAGGVLQFHIKELDRLWILWKSWVNDIMSQLSEGYTAESFKENVEVVSNNISSSTSNFFSGVLANTTTHDNGSTSASKGRSSREDLSNGSTGLRRRKAAKKRHQ